jgi:hypothetical protein
VGYFVGFVGSEAVRIKKKLNEIKVERLSANLANPIFKQIPWQTWRSNNTNFIKGYGSNGSLCADKETIFYFDGLHLSF